MNPVKHLLPINFFNFASKVDASSIVCQSRPLIFFWQYIEIGFQKTPINIYVYTLPPTPSLLNTYNNKEKVKMHGNNKLP